jgi:hypothetical protein
MRPAGRMLRNLEHDQPAGGDGAYRDKCEHHAGHAAHRGAIDRITRFPGPIGMDVRRCSGTYAMLICVIQSTTRYMGYVV